MLRDTSSFNTARSSISTERSSTLSKTFNFDGELQASRIYQRHMRSLVRRVMRGNQKSGHIYPQVPLASIQRTAPTTQLVKPLDSRFPETPVNAEQLTNLSSVNTLLFPKMNDIDTAQWPAFFYHCHEVGILIHTFPYTSISTWTFKDILCLNHEIKQAGYSLVERKKWRRNILLGLTTTLLMFANSIELTGEATSLLQDYLKTPARFCYYSPSPEIVHAMKTLWDDNRIKQACNQFQWDN